MKSKLLKKILLSTIIGTVGIGSVYAVETEYEQQPTNVSDYSVKIKLENGGTVAAKTNLEVTGLTSEKLETSYFVKFVDKDTTSEELALAEIKKAMSLDEITNYEIKPISLKKDTSGTIMGRINDAFFITNKEYYAYIYNCTKIVDGTGKCKPTTESPIKVERDPLLEISKRYHISFIGDSDNKLNMHPLYPHASLSIRDLPLNVKIGIIEDSSVIKAMAHNEAGALQKLYDYAKNATNGITHSNTLDNSSDRTINLNVQNGKYYYVYTTVLDPENKYIDLSDVTIVMAKNNILSNDVEYADDEPVQYVPPVEEVKNYEYACYECGSEYVWTIIGHEDKGCELDASIKQKSKCVISPKTGVENYLLPGTIVLLVGGAIVVLLNKKTHFKKI